ncbi:MAG TPA: MBL fold metallo-hydrolase, partial [Syntrophales bacterium]|nr:MBL fold metallo-hydrolase [Syntrophales bacterium]
MKRVIAMFGTMMAILMLLCVTAYAETGDVTVTFWGQSAFKLESGGKTIIVDPWITYNPAAQGVVTVNDITAADLILITHDHFDHVGDTYNIDGSTIHAGDTIAIAKKTGAIVVAEYETAQRLIAEGLPPQNVLYGGYGRSIGGAIDINGISLVMTTAAHSSDSGVSVGHIIKFPGGATVYHAGDTAIFGDMQIYGALYPIDLALLPIGGGFQMDAVQAAKSLKLLTPKKVIPMHYGTFPMLAPNADEFVAQAK